MSLAHIRTPHTTDLRLASILVEGLVTFFHHKLFLQISQRLGILAPEEKATCITHIICRKTQTDIKLDIYLHIVNKKVN